MIKYKIRLIQRVYICREFVPFYKIKHLKQISKEIVNDLNITFSSCFSF